jgi:hypothetical protein
MKKARHCIVGDDYGETCDTECPTASLCKKEKERQEALNR